MEPDADLLTKRFTERAVQFIKENKDQPFFVYLPHPIPHAPLHVAPEFMVGVPEESSLLSSQKKTAILITAPAINFTARPSPRSIGQSGASSIR